MLTEKKNRVYCYTWTSQSYWRVILQLCTNWLCTSIPADILYVGFLPKSTLIWFDKKLNYYFLFGYIQRSGCKNVLPHYPESWLSEAWLKDSIHAIQYSANTQPLHFDITCFCGKQPYVMAFIPLNHHVTASFVVFVIKLTNKSDSQYLWSLNWKTWNQLVSSWQADG